MSSFAPVPAMSEEQKSPFQKFLVDFPEDAPGVRLPMQVVSLLESFKTADPSIKRWQVGHVEPIGWFIASPKGQPVYLERPEALDSFYARAADDSLTKHPEMVALEKRIASIREDTDKLQGKNKVNPEGRDVGQNQASSDLREPPKLQGPEGALESAARLKDGKLRDGREDSAPEGTMGTIDNTLKPVETFQPTPNSKDPSDKTMTAHYADEAGNWPNQLKVAGRPTEATPIPTNYKIEHDKAESTSSLSSDSTGPQGNKTMIPTPSSVREAQKAASDATTTGNKTVAWSGSSSAPADSGDKTSAAPDSSDAPKPDLTK